MNIKKPVLYVLLSTLGLILIYNYLIAPLLIQYNNRMGMGMHWRMYSNSSYYMDFKLFLLFAFTIAGILLYQFFYTPVKAGKCTKCSKEIEDQRWKICPYCGTPVNNKKG